MDEEMEDFVEDYLEASEIDWDYEFDAAQFFDFSCPESSNVAEEAERWFAIAGNYPDSPLVLKLKWGEDKIASSSLDGGKNANVICKNADTDFGSEGSPPSKDSSEGTEGVIRTKTTSVPRSSKPRSSTLMKPTASHLAKLNKARDGHSSHLCGRFQKSPIHIDERNLQKSPGFDNLATKRQKLEIGYLRKVSHLKHQALLLHKKSKKDGTASAKSTHPKMKVTIPKEPELETLQRAQSRRSRTNSEASERSELAAPTFKARPLNRKILKASSIIPPKKSKSQLPAFQEFNFKTTERALQRSTTNELNTHNADFISQSNPADSKRNCILVRHEVKKICKKSNSDDPLKKEKHEKQLKIKARSTNHKIVPTKEDDRLKNIREETIITMLDKESELRKDQRLSENPPTELFNKLSLRSEFGSDTASQPKALSTKVRSEFGSDTASQPKALSTKGSKENAPDTFQPEIWRCGGKLNQCGSARAIPGIANQSNLNRSLGIR